MAHSLNTQVDFTIKASSLRALSTYGDVMVGDRAFEFYNEKNVEDYIQIPWTEIDHIEAEVLLKRKISRFLIYTKRDGKFAFSTRDNIATLRAVRPHLPQDALRSGLGFFKVLKLGALRVGRTIRKLFSHTKEGKSNER